VEALQTSGIPIRRLATEGNEGLVVWAGVPLAIERYLAGEGPALLCCLLVSGNDFLPDAAFDVVVVVRRDDNEGLTDRVDTNPPEHEPRQGPGLADRVRRHNHRVVVMDDVLDHLDLPGPQLLAEHVSDVPGRIADVRVVGRVKQISEGLPGGEMG
jgi:hypothetical protein